MNDEQPAIATIELTSRMRIDLAPDKRVLIIEGVDAIRSLRARLSRALQIAMPKPAEPAPRCRCGKYTKRGAAKRGHVCMKPKPRGRPRIQPLQLK